MIRQFRRQSKKAARLNILLIALLALAAITAVIAGAYAEAYEAPGARWIIGAALLAACAAAFVLRVKMRNLARCPACGIVQIRTHYDWVSFDYDAKKCLSCGTPLDWPDDETHRLSRPFSGHTGHTPLHSGTGNNPPGENSGGIRTQEPDRGE